MLKACFGLLLLPLLLAATMACGQWLSASNPQRTCVEQLLCTASNFTWLTQNTYTQEAACALLASKGLKDIKFAGDSFQRHLYIGMVLTLTGNYKDGALEEGEHTCDFNAQFEERRCRLKLQLDATLCNDSVRLSCVGGNPPLDMVCSQPLPDSLTLWSIGNHFIAEKSVDEHRGQNSVPHHLALMKELGVCPYAALHPETCRLWWVTTHQRLNTIKHAGFHTEDHSRIHTFNVGMREWFEAGHCGPGNVVDVFNMTHSLVTERAFEAEPLTHDSVHWSMVVNLLKAQILLNDLATALPSVPDAIAPS